MRDREICETSWQMTHPRSSSLLSVIQGIAGYVMKKAIFCYSRHVLRDLLARGLALRRAQCWLRQAEHNTPRPIRE